MNRHLEIAIFAFTALCANAGYCDGSDRSWPYELKYGSRTIYTEQCAQTASELVLRTFEIPYYRQTLKSLLAPTIDGVSVARLVDSLQAHGLKATARKNVPLDDLRQYLTSSTRHLALMNSPGTSGRPGHVALVAASQDSVSVVDFPAGHRSFSWEAMKDADPVAQGKTVCILVETPDGQGSSMADSVRFVPNIVDLNTLKARELAKFEIEIHNPLEHSVVITGFKAQCGCIGVNLPKVPVETRSSLRIPVEINPDRWGQGKQTKLIQFSFGDGSSSSISITATGPVMPAFTPRFQVIPSEIRILSSDCQFQEVINRSISISAVSGQQQDLGKLRLHSSHSWVTGTISLRNAANDWARATAEIGISINKGAIDVSAGGGCARAVLSAYSDDETPQIEIPISVEFPPSPIYSVPGYIMIESGKSCANIVIRANKTANKLKVLSLEDNPVFDAVLPPESGNGQVTIQLTPREDVQANRDARSLRFTVQVENSPVPTVLDVPLLFR